MSTNRYQTRAKIGEGGMQFVYSAYDHLLERDVALKVPKNGSAVKRFQRSAAVSAKVNNRYVAKTLDYFEEDQNQYLIEELITGKDLSAILKDFRHGIDPYLVSRLLHSISIGVAASHHAGVVHRDLKPSNIMIGGGLRFEEIKVTDFGIAKMAEEELDEAVEGGEQSLTASQTAIGALPYMAPEMIASVRSASFPADIWSIGAMCYELLSGTKPFGSGLRAVSRIERGEYSRGIPQISKPQFKPLGEELFALIEKCLQIDPTGRPTAEELVRECSRLCYRAELRRVGTIKSFQHDAWGFLATPGFPDTFYHKDSIYGAAKAETGDRVLYSEYDGGGANRAFPILLMRESGGPLFD